MQNEKEELNIPISEMLKSIPEFFGIHLNEKPEFQVLKKVGDVELRSYSELTIASVTLSGDFDSFRERAFRKLAGYLFGKNSAAKGIEISSVELGEEVKKVASEPEGEAEQMAMTAPVLQQETARGWVMSFVLPKKYTEATAPVPLDSAVKISTIPSRTVAVLQYSGNNTEEKMKEQLAKLRKWVSSDPAYSLVSEPFCAQYDAPFVIPFLKTNEVQAEVRILQ